MSDDPEIRAMSDIAVALGGLEPEAIRRVLKWASDRYQIKSAPQLAVEWPSQPESQTSNPLPLFEDFPALFDAANPQSATDK